MMMFGAVFVWGGLVAIAALLIVLLFPKRRRMDHSNDSTALEILERRYARGEINRNEYLAIRRDLFEADQQD